MFGKKKVKIAFLFIAGLSLVLILLTIAFSVVSMRSVRKLGEFAVNIDEKNIHSISTSLFLEITRRTADEYSVYFSDAEQITRIFAEQIGQEVLSTENLKRIKKTEVKLIPYKGRNFFVNSSDDSFLAYYWGNTKRVPDDVEKKITALSSLTPMIEKTVFYSMGYYQSIWIHGKDDYIFTYPHSRFYRDIQGRNILKKYFSKFDIISIYNDQNNHNRTIWLKPYKDITGNVLLTVFSPVYDEDGNLLCVVGLDMNLKCLFNNMLSSRLFVSDKPNVGKDKDKYKSYNFKGFLFIIGRDGTLIAFPPEHTDLFSLPADYDELTHSSDEIKTKLTDSADPEIRRLANCMTKHAQDVDRIEIKGRKYFVAHCKLSSTGWSLGFAVSEDSLMRLAVETQNEMNRTELEMIKHTFLIAACFLVGSIILALLFFRRFFFRPMEKFREQIRQLASGNFKYKVKDEGIVEMDELASTFNYLGTEINKYMDNLEKEIKARHSIEAEIKIAGDIQRSFLPKISDEFKKRKEFSLFAILSSAKEASGDFYDFFFLSKNKIALLIADVSGKGLSAAFFMGMVKTVLKNICLQETEDPANALNRVNRILSQDNPSLMFVTLFLAYYDIKTGDLKYSNAGHHDVIRFNEEGKFNDFGVMKGIAIGITDEKKYRSRKVVVETGDTLVLYTDGVVEAVNPEHDIYGEERFKELLLKNKDLSCEEIAVKSIWDIRNFEKRKRFDDVTLLVFRRNS